MNNSIFLDYLETSVQLDESRQKSKVALIEYNDFKKHMTPTVRHGHLVNYLAAEANHSAAVAKEVELIVKFDSLTDDLMKFFANHPEITEVTMDEKEYTGKVIRLNKIEQ